MLNALSVGFGGCIGAMLRYLLGTSLFQNSHFPYATLLVNVMGAFLMGILTQLFAETILISLRAKLFLTIGLLGGFTTFSTFSLETVNLVEAGKPIAAFLYAGLSLTLCLAGTFLGKLLVAALIKG